MLIGFWIYGVQNAADAEPFASEFGRIMNRFAYFSSLSNIIVGVVCILLAIKLQRSSAVFRVFWVMGIVSILLTGVIYNVMISGANSYVAWHEQVGHVEHIWVPAAAVLGWLIFGPRTPFRVKYALYAAIYPLVYIVGTIIRGSFVNVTEAKPGMTVGEPYYPYSIVDPAIHGYGTLAIYSVLVLILFILVALAMMGLDKILPGIRPLDAKEQAKLDAPIGQRDSLPAQRVPAQSEGSAPAPAAASSAEGNAGSS